MYSALLRTLRFKIHQRLPRPYNTSKRRLFHERTPPPGPEFMPVELRTEETLPPTPGATHDTSADGPPRRQSTSSLNQSMPAPFPAPAPPDEFASDDEETEIISATLISFDVEAADPTTPHDLSPPHDLSTTNPNGGGDTTPGVWSAELRPNLSESARAGAGGLSMAGTPLPPPDPVYRENVLTRLPAILATDVLAITPARIAMTPFVAAVWLGLARPYMARMGTTGGMEVVEGLGWWGGLWSARALGNMLVLELVLGVLHGEAWAAIMMAAWGLQVGEEEWNEREGVAAGRGEEERGEEI